MKSAIFLVKYIFNKCVDLLKNISIIKGVSVVAENSLAEVGDEVCLI